MLQLRVPPFFRSTIPGVLLLLCALIAAQAEPAGTSDFLMDVWTSDDDLPDSSVTAITQTRDGYLWIGTYNRLARFDGVRFVYFDPLNTPALKHARVHALGLFTGKDGTLWINTYDGSMTSMRDGVFTHEWQGGQVSAVFSQSNLTYFALLRGGLICREESGGTNWHTVGLPGPALGTTFRQDAGGDLWFMTREGMVGRVTGTNCTTINLGEYGLAGRTVNYLTSDQTGQVWVATDKEIARWTGRSFENMTPTNGAPTLNATFIYCGDGRSGWVVADGGVRAFRDRQWMGEVPAWHELASANTAFMSSHMDHRNRVWLRSFGQGLFYTSVDGVPRRMTAAQGLPNNRVSCWFEDNEHNIWLGVDRGGLVRLRERRFQVIGAAQGVTIPAVSSVCEDQDQNIWFGTFGGGLHRWAAGKLDSFALPEGPNPKSFFSVYPATDNQLWVSAGGEDLYLMTNGAVLSRKNVHGVKAILADREDGVWLGRQNGLSRLTGTNLVSFSTRGDLERVDVRTLAEDRRGRIWIGAGNGRVYQFEHDKFTAYQADDALKNQAVWSLLPDDDGTLWIGTFRGGLLRLKDGKFTRYTTQSGLPSDVICQILDDGLGRLWIGSHRGLFQVAKDALHNFDPNGSQPLPCVSYGLFDGLPTLEFTGNYQPACWKDHQGRLWFATVKGLVSVHPDRMDRNRLPPPVAIEEVQLDGKPLTDKFGRVPAKLDLPPGKRQLDFRFTALSFAAPDKTRFRYRLAGFEDAWVEADTRRFAHYGPLPPGQYHFQVLACNNDGVWNAEGATISLTQLPQFWQTWWFQGLGAVALLGGIFGTVRFIVTRRLRQKLEQLKQQRAIARERERIAKDIHDDLGAGLTQILLQSSLARRGTQGQVQTDFTQIADTARELVRAMDEIVWAIDPENDTLDGLVTYLGKFVEDFVTATGKRCRIVLPPQLPAHSISAEARHNLYLAIKEALNNAIKHSGASEISFQLKIQPQTFTFVIKDNGSGFDPSTESSQPADDTRISSGHGLRNIVQRLEAVGGACAILSEPGKGTAVELSLALNSNRKSTQ